MLLQLSHFPPTPLHPAHLPDLAKEIDFREVQEAQRVPKKLYPRRNTPRYIIIPFPKIKEKEKIFKAARKMKLPTKEFS